MTGKRNSPLESSSASANYLIPLAQRREKKLCAKLFCPTYRMFEATKKTQSNRRSHSRGSHTEPACASVAEDQALPWVVMGANEMHALGNSGHRVTLAQMHIVTDRGEHVSILEWLQKCSLCRPFFYPFIQLAGYLTKEERTSRRAETFFVSEQISG